MLRQFLKDRTGSAATEYVLIGAIVSMSTAIGLEMIGTSLVELIGSIARALALVAK